MVKDTMKQFMLLFAATILISFISSNVASASSNTVPIKFVVTNYKNSSFMLYSGASLQKLYTETARSCNIPYGVPIEIHSGSSLGEVIVSPSMTTQIKRGCILKHPSILSMMETLRECWGEDSQFAIPIRVYPLKAPEEDIATYDALKRMFYGLNADLYDLQIIKNCVERKCYTLKCLGELTEQRFCCLSGKLTTINLSNQDLRGELNLSILPGSVELVRVDKNLLTNCIGLDKLAGKQLKSLDMRGNPCKIELQSLERSSTGSKDNPMRAMKVDAAQVRFNFHQQGSKLSLNGLYR